MEDIFQNMMTKKPIAFILRGTDKLRPHINPFTKNVQI